jgi:hypothetical protein
MHSRKGAKGDCTYSAPAFHRSFTRKDLLGAERQRGFDIEVVLGIPGSLHPSVHPDLNAKTQARPQRPQGGGHGAGN